MPKRTFTQALSQALTGSSAPSSASGNMGDSLRASARVDALGEKDAINKANMSGVKQWQQQCWTYYDTVGEVHYSSNFVGACLSRCRLTIGIPDDDGHVGPAFDDKGVELAPGASEAQALIMGLKGQTGGQAGLLKAMGLNLAIAGELHLVGSAPGANTRPAITDIPMWEVLSTDEFKRVGEDYQRIYSPGSTPVPVKAESVHVIRIWRSHPRFSELPDSPLRAVLDILEELVLLTREVRGEALSRLTTTQVLAMPEEIEYPDDEGEDAGSDAGDPFTRDLIETMSTAISDKGSAAGIAPFVLRAPADLIDKIQLFDLSPKSSGDSAAKRTEAVQRFAQGVDLPVEVVTGHAQTTFANAVSIDDATSKVHIEPVLEIIDDALTTGYLRPILGQDTPFVVITDTTELVSRPNRAQDAKDVHEAWALSDAALRNHTGFSDADAPDDAEIAKRVAIKQATAGKSATDSPGVSSGAVIDTGNNLDKQLQAAGVRAGVEHAVERAVARAGARLRSKAKKNQSVYEQLAQVANAEVGLTLGPKLVHDFMGNEDLFAGEFDTLHMLVTRWTGNRDYADAVKEVCREIASERFMSPRQAFPYALLPGTDGKE